MKKTWTRKKLLGVVWPSVIQFVSSYAWFIKLTIFKAEYQHLKSGEHLLNNYLSLSKYKLICSQHISSNHNHPITTLIIEKVY